MNIFQNFFGCPSHKKRVVYNLNAPISYHLPEGRYYEAPLILAQKRSLTQYIFPLILGAGISIIGLTSLQKQTTQSSMPANASRFINASQMANQIKTDEQRINSNKKQGFMTRERPDLQLALNNRRIDNKKQPILAQKLHENYMMHLALELKHKYQTQLALSNIPVPKQKEFPTLPVPKILASLVTNDKPDVLALGYASINAGNNKETPFDSILADDGKQEGRFIPPIGRDDHAWAATPLPAASFTAKEQKCLAEAIYFESRSETIKGQAAVAQVVLNRVRNPAYPNTICGVVYQNVNWRNRCQFSFACDGRKHYVTEKRHWRLAQDIARAVSAGQIWLPDIGSATHYHATYVRPNWASAMYKTEKIGLHIFYRTRNGGLS